MGKNVSLGPRGFCARNAEIHMGSIFCCFVFVVAFSLFLNPQNSVFITCVFSACRFYADPVGLWGWLIIPTLRPEYENGVFWLRGYSELYGRWQARCQGSFSREYVDVTPSHLFKRLKPEVTALKTGSRLDRNLSYFMSWTEYRCALIRVWMPHCKISSSEHVCPSLWVWQDVTFVWC